ncbi:MAG: HNH endonuclease [Sedimentisphaerales bacterium]|nr:HNH endonuclease [Sedimentisphaerales bacterium]
MAQKKKITSDLPEFFIKRLKSVNAKRPKTVIDHIMENGFVTTEELSQLYGYDHAPRAARDVRELGIPLETFRVKGKSGRRIAAYRFGDLSKIRDGKIDGRKAWPKALKSDLVSANGESCSICFTTFEERYLQIDHRIPYEVGGTPEGELNIADFMLLCGSCNRAKSWSCEHCINWKTDHLIDVCKKCYWANPADYKHVALRLIRRLDITWTEEEVPYYERLVNMSKYAEKDLPAFVKECLCHISDENAEDKT